LQASNEVVGSSIVSCKRTKILKVRIAFIVFAFFLLVATGCNSPQNQSSTTIASPSPSASPSPDESHSANDSPDSADPVKLEKAKEAVRIVRQGARSKGFDPEGFDLLEEDGVNFLQTAEKYCQTIETEGVKKVAADLASAVDRAKSNREKFLTAVADEVAIAYTCPKYRDEFVKEFRARQQ
jgi:hypothetical protein